RLSDDPWRSSRAFARDLLQKVPSQRLGMTGTAGHWPFIHSTYRFTHPGGWRAVWGRRRSKMTAIQGPSRTAAKAQSRSSSAADWTPTSWRSRPAQQMPIYDDAATLAGSEARL